jgi:peptidoglycan/xylan/chitin deacetylase (PgdA/CDA1 family)
MGALLLVVAAVAPLSHTAPFPFLLELFHRSVWRVRPDPNAPPTVYVTFDDGPNPDWTPALLDALQDHGVRATFFLIDRHISAETATVVKRIADEGHAIGLHSGDRWLMLDGSDVMAGKIEDAAARIRTVTGREPCHLFRPHGGWRSAAMYSGLRKAGYTLVGWSWRMWDWNWWRGPNVDPVVARLARSASAGSIVVIHDGHHVNPRADRRHSIEIVRRLIPRLRDRGFAFGTLCDASTAAPAAR